MRIKRLRLRNCLSVGEEGLELDDIGDLTVLVGPNDSGKSNILRAVDLLAQIAAGYSPDMGFYHYAGDFGKELEVELTVRLHEREVEAVSDFMVQAINGSLNSPPIPKIAWNEARHTVLQVTPRLRSLFRSLVGGDVTYHLRSQGGPFGHRTLHVKLSTSEGDYYTGDWSRLGINLDDESYGFQPVSFAGEIIKLALVRFPGALDEGAKARRLTLPEIQGLVSSVNPTWFRSLFPKPVNLPAAMEFTQVDLQARSRGSGERVDDILSLASFLFGLGYSKNWITLEGLLGFILRSSISRLSDARVRPPGEGITGFSEIPTIYYTIDGSEIAAALYKLKNSPNQGAREGFRRIQKNFEHLTGSEVDVVHESIIVPAAPAEASTPTLRRELEPAPPASRESMNPSIRISRFGNEVPLSFASAGDYETLLVLFEVANSRESIIILDEPALNLHPTRQKELLAVVTRLCTEEHNQLIIVTHSSHLVPVRNLAAVVRVTRENGMTVIHRPRLAYGMELERMMQDLTHFPRLVAALFARKVVLVEGAAEEASLPTWLEKCKPGLDFEALNIEFLSVDGDTFFARHEAPLRSWGIPRRLIGDRKAAKNLARFGADAFAYDSDDMGMLIETQFQSELTRLEAEFAGPINPKRPTVIRLVAQRTSPPEVVRSIWQFLEPFVEDSADPTG